MSVSLLDIESLSRLSDFESEHNLYPWNEEQLRHALKDPATYVLGYIEDGNLLGHCVFKIIVDECDFQHIIVSSSKRRKGIAASLLRDTISLSQENSVKKISLEVREKNMAARRLYEQFNFEVDAVRQNYYKNPLDNALLMTRSI